MKEIFHLEEVKSIAPKEGQRILLESPSDIGNRALDDKRKQVEVARENVVFAESMYGRDSQKVQEARQALAKQERLLQQMEEEWYN
jgi:hypothetical protein